MLLILFSNFMFKSKVIFKRREKEGKDKFLPLLGKDD